MDGSLFEIGQVHRNLGQAAHQESGALDKAQPATRNAHSFRDFFGNVNVRRIQEDVVGNQELARTDDGCAGRGMHARFAEIGRARGIGRYVGTDAFELAATSILQVLALGGSCGGFIQIDRDLETLRDLGSDVARDGDAVFDGDAVNRDKGHDVGCAHARVRALMLGEIDQFGGFAYPANGGFLDGFALPYECDDAAVVVGIHFAVEKINARDLHGFDNRVDFGRVAAFGKIRNAFNKSAGHGEKDNGQRFGQATGENSWCLPNSFTTKDTKVHEGAHSLRFSFVLLRVLRG